MIRGTKGHALRLIGKRASVWFALQEIAMEMRGCELFL